MLVLLGVIITVACVVGLALDWWRHPEAVEEWRHQR
jgi:hypothetical protein